MRNEMQQIRILSEQLDNVTDPREKERIQEEIWALEEEMEFSDEREYKANHGSKFLDY